MQTLIEQGNDKNTQLIALGGGMITDITSFIGATYKRGIDTYLVPTTLLSMVDATIGGKCGVNFGEVKNRNASCLSLWERCPVDTLGGEGNKKCL